MTDEACSSRERLRAGESIHVTRRGEVVAEIRSPYGTRPRRDVPPGLARLAERGLLRLGAPNDPALYPLPAEAVAEGTAGELLDEERGER